MVTSIKGNDTSTFGGNVDVPYITTDAAVFAASKNATGGNQSISPTTWTKITWDEETFDYENGFDLANNKFIAPVNGIYYINGHIRMNAGTDNYMSIYKNGSQLYVYQLIKSANSSLTTVNSQLVSLNANDYIEFYVYSNNSCVVTNNLCYCSGHLVRAV